MNERSFKRHGLRDPGSTRDLIERAALQLFLDQGIGDTSIREIAKLAGVSQGAMYNHYESKEQLAWELFAHGWSEMGQSLREIAHGRDDLASRLVDMIGYVFDYYDRDPQTVGYVFQSRHLHLHRITPKFPNPYLAFRLVIAEGIRKGEIPRRDPELMTSLVVGAVIQVTDSKLLGRLKKPLRDYTKETADRCLSLLKGP
jgi:AcrR family transcriptional regulator